MSDKTKEFIRTVLLGLAIVVVLHFFENSRWGESLLNRGYDALVLREALATSFEEGAKENKISGRLAFIDIDRDTYSHWGEPLLTPREALAALLGRAAAGGAKVILLDVLLEHHDTDPAAEETLRRQLISLAESDAPPYVVFPVRINSAGKIRSHLFDGLIDKYPNYFRAVPNIIRNYGDYTVRYWGAFQTGEGQKGEKQVLWGSSFLSAALLAGEMNELEEIGKNILAREDGAPGAPGRAAAGFRSHDGSMRTEVFVNMAEDDAVYQRIRYLLRPAGVYAEDDSGNLYGEVISAGKEMGLIEGYPVPSGEDLERWFGGKLVIIGNTSPDAGDIHKTPLGEMPGMYILGNAVNTLLQGLQPKTLTFEFKALRFALEAGLILFVASAYYFLHGYLVRYLMALALVAVFFPMSSFFFERYGMLIDFIIPATALVFQHRVYRTFMIAREGLLRDKKEEEEPPDDENQKREEPKNDKK